MKTKRGKVARLIDGERPLKDNWTAKDVDAATEVIAGFAAVGAAVIRWYREAPGMFELFFGTELERDGVTEKYVYVQKRNGMDDEVFELSNHPSATEISSAIYQALEWAKATGEMDDGS